MSDLTPILATQLAALLTPELARFPPGFFNSFRYTTTGNNLTHPLMIGLLARFLWELKSVHTVGVDVRFNAKGVKFQPDVVGFESNGDPLVYIDYESPNSSDARILTKDIDAYCAWQAASGKAAPYILITTLPDVDSPSWELRYTAAGYYNASFLRRQHDVRRNPFRFWYGYYAHECARRCMDGIALLNINGAKVETIDLALLVTPTKPG